MTTEAQEQTTDQASGEGEKRELTQGEVLEIWKALNSEVQNDPNLYPKMRGLEAIKSLRESMPEDDSGPLAAFKQEVAHTERAMKIFAHESERLYFRLWAVGVVEKIRSTVEEVQSKWTLPESYQAFENERVQLLQKYAQKDQNGEPIIRGNEYQLDPDWESQFREEAAALQEQHSEALKERNQMIEAFFSEISRTNSGFVIGEHLHPIPANNLPPLPAQSTMALEPLIEF